MPSSISKNSERARDSDLLNTLFTPGPPDLGLKSRGGRLSPAAINGLITLTLANPSLKFKLTSKQVELLTGVTLLWHDCFSEAHQLAQSHEGQADFDLLHAIFHRREGDYSNSKYWFSSAGKHPCYLNIVEAFSADNLNAWRIKLLPQGIWIPSAFVSEISRLQVTEISLRQELENIQAIEIQSFAKWIVTGK
jgi:hypothetical protein